MLCGGVVSFVPVVVLVFVREKTRHARLVGDKNGIKLSQQEQNAPNWEILGLLGEFCTGTGAVWLVWGEFCTGSGGVPVLLLVVAGQNSPCSACWQQKRDKTLPARAKRTKLGDFGRAG